MKAFLIDPATEEITEQFFDGQPNSLYTLFGTLLVDSNDILNGHTVYGASEAFERAEKGFFLGEKLLFGKVLVVGTAGIEDVDATMSLNELRTLALFNLPDFYEKTLRFLPPDFAFDTRYDLALGGIHESVTPEWVFYVFNMADNATKYYFLTNLEAAQIRGEDLHNYFKQMGALALKAAR